MSGTRLTQGQQAILNDFNRWKAQNYEHDFTEETENRYSVAWA